MQVQKFQIQMKMEMSGEEFHCIRVAPAMLTEDSDQSRWREHTDKISNREAFSIRLEIGASSHALQGIDYNDVRDYCVLHLFQERSNKNI